MNSVLQIANKELKAFFYSPVAWAGLIAFLIMINDGFLPHFEEFLTQKQKGMGLYGLTSILLAEGQLIPPLYGKVITTLILIMPLLTMSIMSREYTSGSIKMLYCSPIRTVDIILGKFAAMVGIGLIMLCVVFVYVIVGSVSIENFDFISGLPGLLGIFFLICAYSAVGIFISSLTRYQIIAAMGTVGVFMLLGVIGEYGQNIPLIREVAFWLSMGQRTDGLASGMISSQDIVYFIMITSTFLALTVIRMDNQRFALRGSVRAGRYAIVAACVVAVAFISSHPALMFYYDATRTKKLTVTATTQHILDMLPGKLTFTSYANILGGGSGSYAMPSNYSVMKSNFEPFARFKPDIKLDFVYYYDTPPGGENLLYERFPDLDNMEAAARRVAALEKFSFGRLLSPEQIRAKADLLAENNNFLMMLTRSGGEQSMLRMPGYGLPSELMIATALNRFLEPDLKVGFVSGGRSITENGQYDYYMFTGAKYSPLSLFNIGFTCEEVMLEPGSDAIPPDIEMLVVADPAQELTPYQFEQLCSYIDSGRNLMIAGEPGRQHILDPLLAHIGYQYVPGRLVQEHEHDIYPQDLILAKYPEENRPSASVPAENEQRVGVTMPGAMAIRMKEDKGFVKQTLLTCDTTQLTWTELQTMDFGDGQKAIFQPGTGEQAGQFDMAVVLGRQTNGRSQRIIIMGDADCISTSELMLRRDRGLVTSNATLITEIFSVLSNDRRPLDMSRMQSTDNDIKYGPAGLKARKIIFRWILPAMTIMACIVILFRRKSK